MNNKENFSVGCDIAKSIPLFGGLISDKSGCNNNDNGNTSTAKAITTTNITNTTQLNDFNKSIFDTGIDVMVNNLQTCSKSAMQTNNCKFVTNNTGGTTTNNADSTNYLTDNYSCTNASAVQSEMASKMFSAAASQIDTLTNDNLKAAMKAQSEAMSKTGFLSSPSSSSSISNVGVNTNIRNEAIQNIKNTYKQKFNTNFTSNTVAECIGIDTQNNSLSFYTNNSAGKTVNICNPSNNLNTIQNCKQLSNVVAQTTNQVFQEYNINTNSTNNAEQSIISSSKSSDTVIATGPIQEFFKGISEVLGSVSNGFIFIIIIIVIIVSVVLCSAIMMFNNKNDIKKFQKGGSYIKYQNNIMSSDSAYL